MVDRFAVGRRLQRVDLHFRGVANIELLNWVTTALATQEIPFAIAARSWEPCV